MKSLFNRLFVFLLTSSMILDPAWTFAFKNSGASSREIIFTDQALSLPAAVSDPPRDQPPVNPSAKILETAAGLARIAARSSIKSSIPKRIVRWWKRLPPESKWRYWSKPALAREMGISVSAITIHLPAAIELIQNSDGPVIATDIATALVQYALFVPKATEGLLTRQDIALALGITPDSVSDNLPNANLQLQQLQRPPLSLIPVKSGAKKGSKKIHDSPAVVPTYFQYKPEAVAAAGIKNPKLVRLLTAQEEVTPEIWEILLDVLLDRQQVAHVEEKSLSPQEKALFLLTLDVASQRFPLTDISRAAGLPINRAGTAASTEFASIRTRDALLKGIQSLRRGEWPASQASQTKHSNNDQRLRVGAKLLEKSPTLQNAPTFDSVDKAVDWIRENQDLIKKELLGNRGGGFIHILLGLAAAKKASLNWRVDVSNAHHALEKEEPIRQKLADTWAGLTQETSPPQRLRAVLNKTENIVLYIADRSFLTDLRHSTKPVSSLTASNILRWAMRYFGNELVKGWTDSWRASHSVVLSKRSNYTPEKMIETFAAALRESVPLASWGEILSYAGSSEPVRRKAYQVAMALAKQQSRLRKRQSAEPPAFGSLEDLRKAAVERVTREAA